MTLVCLNLEICPLNHSHNDSTAKCVSSHYITPEYSFRITNEPECELLPLTEEKLHEERMTCATVSKRDSQQHCCFCCGSVWKYESKETKWLSNKQWWLWSNLGPEITSIAQRSGSLFLLGSVSDWSLERYAFPFPLYRALCLRLILSS